MDHGPAARRNASLRIAPLRAGSLRSASLRTATQRNVLEGRTNAASHPSRPPGQISLETGLLVQYFANWRPLEQRGYEVIKKETGIDIQASPGNARYQSAARILRRAPYHVDLSTVRGKGVIRNDSARSMQEAEGGARQIRRCVRRRKARINCIDLEALSEDEHKRVQTLAAQLNVIDQFASPRSRRIIEQEIIQPREKLPVEQVLLAFMRKKK